MGLSVCRCGIHEDDEPEYDKVESYTGETKLGKRHGKGLYLYPNGDMYDGEWKWGKKHGYGEYTFSNGTRQVGFYYEDKYIGKEPGDLFAIETQRPLDSDPSKPLTPPPTKAEIEAKERETAEQQAIAYERHLENERKKKEWRRTREDIRRKYGLDVPGKCSLPNKKQVDNGGSRHHGRRRDRLLEPNKRVGYDSVNW